MQGLMEQAPQQQAPQQAPQQQAPQEAVQQEAVDSQEGFDIAVGQMIKWLASDQGYKAAVEALKNDPSKGMALMIGRLLVMITQGANMSGKSLAPKVVFQAGMAAAKALSQIAVKEGILTKENEAQITEDAFFDGLAAFGKEATEEALSQESRQQFIQLIDAVEQMAGGKQA